MKVAKKLSPRNKPVQQRALRQREKILQATSELLDKVGLDDLTTILVAKRVGISVGTLYHYFPNKHAIMYALAELWVKEIELAMQELAEQPIETTSIKAFVELSVERMLLVYLNHSALLPLVQAMQAVPELKELNAKYQDIVSNGMARIFQRLDISVTAEESARLAHVYLEISHALLLSVAIKSVSNHNKTLADLKYLILCLLERAKGQF